MKTQPTNMTASNQFVEVRVKGRWVKMPVMEVNGHRLLSRGKQLKIAYVRGEEMSEKELETPELYLAALKSKANHILRADIFTFPQKLPSIDPKYAYPFELESVAAIRLESFKQWWEGLSQVTRKNVRRAEKRGVLVRVKEFDEALLKGLKAVNDDSPTRQGMRNAYYGLTLDETRNRYAEYVGRCDFICAYSGDEMIGFLHLVYRGDVASILNLTTKPSHFDKRPANALMARAVEICEARKISHISYGLYHYGNKRDSPLLEFKIRNGFEEILVPRYFIPLNVWGRFCIKAKFHRGLIGILPPSVIAAGLNARTRMYQFIDFIRRCSLTAEQPNSNRQMECSNPPAGSTSLEG